MTETIRFALTLLLAGVAITLVAVIWTWVRGGLREAGREVHIVRPAPAPAPAVAIDADEDDDDLPF